MSHIETSNVVQVDLKLVKELRDRTGLGMNDCRKAIIESNNDIEVAIDLLRQWGELRGKEREKKAALEGIVSIYGNNSGSVVGIYEVNCQTDFVARSEAFINLTHLLDNKMDGFSTDRFEEARKQLVAKTGENIVLRRKEQFNAGAYTYIGSYVHPGSRLATIVEIDLQTKEVWESSHDLCREFAETLAMHIAAASPLVVSKEEISTELSERYRAIFAGQLANEKKPKPESAWPKIIDGKIAKWHKEIVLLEQDSVIEPNKTIGQFLQELNKKANGDIKIVRFVRYALGEGQVVEKTDLASEVAKLTSVSEAQTQRNLCMTTYTIARSFIMSVIDKALSVVNSPTFRRVMPWATLGLVVVVGAAILVFGN